VAPLKKGDLKIFCPLFKGVGGSKVCEATLKKLVCTP
jgi:hypothetical protein